ncbi:hypothetical protein D3C73_1131550 [compost metagenome]
MVADGTQQRVERQGFLRVETGGRFVQAQKFRPGAHGAGDFQAALRTIGKVTCRIVGTIDEIGHFQPVLCLLDRSLRGVLVGRQAEKTEDREARSLHQHVVLRDQQVFQNRQAGKQPDVLEGAGNTRDLVDLEIAQALQQELLAVVA